MNLTKELEVVEKASRMAGQAILGIAKDGFETAHKANQDPVTTADLEANHILTEMLRGAFPDYGWLSEETRDNPDRLSKNRVWVVDPIDGTKEYVMGLPEYAVSVALVENGQPVLGCVYNPAAEEMFLAVKNEGAQMNEKAIHADHPLAEKPVTLASRSEIKRGEWQVFEPYMQVHIMGSIAYKLAVVASGRADSTFSLGPKNEWDIAAGVLLVQEAGGISTGQDGKPFLFNQPNTLVNGIVGTSQAANALTMELIRRYGG